jgi:hypothetical protein
MLAAPLQAEVNAHIARHAQERDETGRLLLVGNQTARSSRRSTPGAVSAGGSRIG